MATYINRLLAEQILDHAESLNAQALAAGDAVNEARRHVPVIEAQVSWAIRDT